MKKKVCVVCKDGVVEMMMEENEISSLLDKVTGNETTDWEAFEKYSHINDFEKTDTNLLESLIKDLKALNKKYGDKLEMSSDYKGDDVLNISFSYEGLYKDLGIYMRDYYKDWHKRKANEVSQRYGMEDMN